MAARRGKTQARRNQGNGGGLPGWAWGVMGLLLGVGLIVAAPRLLKSDGDGFFRPQPNPDAEPAPVGANDDEVAAGDEATARDDARPSTKAPSAAGKDADYDFYTLLPGKEVALSDAELAATERAEAQRSTQQQADMQRQAQAAGAAGDANPTASGAAASPTATAPLPAPVDPAREPASTAAATASITPAPKPAATVVAPAATAPDSDNTRYLLQAGAFQASGQAEELKARIALLGLGARVESAAIRGTTVYRVRMGPYGSAGELAEAKRKLANGGLPGMAIKVE